MNKVRRGDTHTIEIQWGLGSYIASCVDAILFKLGDGKSYIQKSQFASPRYARNFKKRNLQARATRVTSKIVIYKPALRAKFSKPFYAVGVCYIPRKFFGMCNSISCDRVSPRRTLFNFPKRQIQV